MRKSKELFNKEGEEIIAGKISTPKGRALMCSLLAIMMLPLSQVRAGQDTVTTLGEVTVEGRKIEERLSSELAEFGHKVEIVTAKEIKQGGYTDVNQVLESLVPGLYVSTKGGRGDYMRLSLNGGDTKQVVFLIDGVRINNRLYGRGYLDTLSPKMIERIEVLKNGEGLFYGTDSVTGVINIITKKITRDRHVEVGAGYGSYEAAEAHGLATETIAGNGLLVFGSYDGWKGYQPFQDEDYARIEGARKKNRGYNRNSLMVKYQRQLEHLGKGALLQASLLRNGAKLDYARINEDEALNDRTEYVGILKWNHDVTDDFSYYIKAYYHDWWTDYTRQKLDGTFVFNEALWGYEDWGVNVMASWFFHEQNELLFGLDYQNYWGRDEVLPIKGDNEDVQAVFFALRPSFNFWTDLKLSLGGRYNKTGGNNKFVWNVSGRTPILGKTYLRASASTNFRLANAWELYANDPAWGTGNPDLKPEESYNVDVGIGGTFGLVTAEVGYSYTNISDMIALGNNTVFENTDKEVTLKNLELQLSTSPFHGFSTVASICFTDATEEGSDKQIVKIPESFFKGLIRYEHPEKFFGTDLTIRYIGKITSGNYFGNSYDTYYGEHWLTDWSVFYRFGNDLSHMISLRVDNLFDEDYVTYGHQTAIDSYTDEKFLYGFRGEPRAVMVSYTFTF